ncbi:MULTISPECIES: hypothetical protein [unclassified Blastococcus]
MSPTLIAPAAEPAVHPLRRLRTAAVLAGAGLRPTTSRRAAVCGAARLLTALGVRVRVHAPLVAWPRVRPGGPGVLVVADSASDLAHLALATAVPGAVAVDGRPGRHARTLRLPTVPATTEAIAAALRTGRTVTLRPGVGGTHSPAGFAAAAAVGAPVCPVAVRMRPAAGAGVHVALHLLPEVAGASGDAAALAARARRALAAVPGGLAAGARPEPARVRGQRGPSTR